MGGLQQPFGLNDALQTYFTKTGLSFSLNLLPMDIISDDVIRKTYVNTFDD